MNREYTLIKANKILREYFNKRRGENREAYQHCSCSLTTCCGCAFFNNTSCILHPLSGKLGTSLHFDALEKAEEYINQVDWSKVAVDTPIWVRDYEERPWVRRYFSSFSDGKVFTYIDGKTSWTGQEFTEVKWKQAKLAETESGKLGTSLHFDALEKAEEYINQVDWSKVAVDTPIWVRDYEKRPWVRRYFSSFSDGKVFTYIDGKTSWTGQGFTEVKWEQAKLAETESEDK